MGDHTRRLVSRGSRQVTPLFELAYASLKRQGVIQKLEPTVMTPDMEANDGQIPEFIIYKLLKTSDANDLRVFESLNKGVNTTSLWRGLCTSEFGFNTPPPPDEDASQYWSNKYKDLIKQREERRGKAKNVFTAGVALVEQRTEAKKLKPTDAVVPALTNGRRKGTKLARRATLPQRVPTGLPSRPQQPITTSTTSTLARVASAPATSQPAPQAALSLSQFRANRSTSSERRAYNETTVCNGESSSVVHSVVQDAVAHSGTKESTTRPASTRPMKKLSVPGGSNKPAPAASSSSSSSSSGSSIPILRSLQTPSITGGGSSASSIRPVTAGVFGVRGVGGVLGRGGSAGNTGGAMDGVRGAVSRSGEVNKKRQRLLEFAQRTQSELQKRRKK
eukprot:TRINITY_DN47622_c0_g1_i1.p2 TRINITY_DN47622_c0_g1~~TRINITY_DN47622_c0_g1_i1.p2  ORF type:complete len:402 (+),score=34.36 TRINITY_DN47622_c0_g1_i1:34-1206(+)